MALTHENKLALGFATGLAVIIALAVLAMGRPPASQDATLQDLPTHNWNEAFEPTESQCAAAGGEVRYERTNECFSEPSVRDVCGFGVPCIDAGITGSYCIDEKDPYCSCSSDDQCPDGYTCEKTFAPARCYKPTPDSYPPKPLMIR